MSWSGRRSQPAAVAIGFSSLKKYKIDERMQIDALRGRNVIRVSFRGEGSHDDTVSRTGMGGISGTRKGNLFTPFYGGCFCPLSLGARDRSAVMPPSPCEARVGASRGARRQR